MWLQKKSSSSKKSFLQDEVIIWLTAEFFKSSMTQKHVTNLSLQRWTCKTSPPRSLPPAGTLSPLSWWRWVMTPTACASCPLRWACTTSPSSTRACTCQAAPSSSQWGRWARAGPLKSKQEVQDWRERRPENQVLTETLLWPCVLYLQDTDTPELQKEIC